ncbi:MAG: histidinol dehydrogenase [Bacteroidetes bacterium]|jgi:histidinol dehydrogenase|nr:histidinol dehydrogenase [Bacteroidota bacterium]
MKIIVNPLQEALPELLQRPVMDHAALQTVVQGVLDAVRTGGDKAVASYTKQFDGVTIDDLQVSEAAINEATLSLEPALKEAIQLAAKNIKCFHEAQVNAPVTIETMPGVRCWRKSVGIDKVGLYIPGGSAPLFSTVLMLGIPAVIAGCKEIILCTPPSKDGSVHPAILYAASVVGITRIYKLGGVQAIAAMAYGTETVPQVYKIFGPGNQYVTAAKQLVQQNGVAIDMPAGPSEVCVLADETCNPGFVASDLLSQAEHGPDSQVLLVSTSSKVVDEINEALTAQLEVLPRKDIAQQALENSKAIVVDSMDQAIFIVNSYAAEHLIIACKNDETIGEQITNAGSVFLGNYSPESVGDYASGTNHTLPTSGYARAYSGVSVDSFVKKITYQKLTPAGLQAIGAAVETMAAAEGLEAHKNAITIRLQSL